MTNFDVPRDEKIRPGVVTTAAALQLLVFVLTVLGLILSLVYADAMADAMRTELESQGAPQDVIDQAAGSSSNSLSLIIGVVLALVYAVLAFLNLKGSNGSRITTWVISGLMLLCSVIGLVATNLFSSVDTGDIDINKMMEAGYEAVPGWYNAFSTVSTVLSIICYLAVVILLAMPASNRFFAKKQPGVALPPEAG
jgi:hypothetical protein